jgi:hypothetical protein
LKVIEHVLGRPPERMVPMFSMPEDANQIECMTWVELRVLAARLVADLPAGGHVTIDGMTRKTMSSIVAD